MTYENDNKITFVNSQHENTNSKGDFLHKKKNGFNRACFKISVIQVFDSDLV